MPLGPRHIQHFGVPELLGLFCGVRVGDAGAQKLQPALPLIFADEVGQQRFHRAALHGGHRQLRRRDQQHFGA